MAPIRPSRTGSQAGFTLTELLVVLAIIGLLILAAPSLLDKALPGTQSLAAARALANDMRLARGMAVSRGMTVTLRFDPARQIYVQSAQAGAHALPNHVRFALPPRAASDAIVFRADGSSSGGVVLVGQHPQHRVAADWLTGRVSVDE